MGVDGFSRGDGWSSPQPCQLRLIDVGYSTCRGQIRHGQTSCYLVKQLYGHTESGAGVYDPTLLRTSRMLSRRPTSRLRKEHNALRSSRFEIRVAAVLLALVGILLSARACTLMIACAAARRRPEAAMRQQLDAPLFFVKRHSYTGIHIYDTYYKWPPGGGGIYVIENPAEPREAGAFGR